MLINITEMIMSSRTSTPTEPMMIDSLLDSREMEDSAEFEKDSVESECDDDIHGITGQDLWSETAGVLNEEQPKINDA